MGLNITPNFRLIANTKDVTATIRDRLHSIRLTDEAGTVSDTLEIVITDHDPAKPVKMPATGAELELSLGYDGEYRPMGLFIVDEVEIEGPPSQISIRARAAPYDKSTKGKADLQTQKTRSWKAGTTLGAMVQKMAKEHGMTAAVSPSIASIVLPHEDQTNESDMNLLHRLGKRYDAVAKPAGGNLVMTARGDSKSATGKPLPRVTVAYKEMSLYRVTMAKRDSPGTVTAYYRDIAKAKRKAVSIGEGEPVKTIRQGFKDRASALAAVKAEQTKRARGESTLNLTIPGNPELIAESIVALTGFREEANGDWIVTRAEHYLGSQGYRTTIEGERPNADKKVAAAQGGKTKDIDQPTIEEG